MPTDSPRKVRFHYPEVVVVLANGDEISHLDVGFTVNDGHCVIVGPDSLWRHIYAPQTWNEVYGDGNPKEH